MTAAAYRRIALGMSGAVEGSHMDHPDFRAEGKIFATLRSDSKSGALKLTPEQQQAFLRDYPDMFEPESGAWGRQGYTRVFLARATPEVVGEAMTLAWQNVMAAPPRARSRSRKAR